MIMVFTIIILKKNLTIINSNINNQIPLLLNNINNKITFVNSKSNNNKLIQINPISINTAVDLKISSVAINNKPNINTSNINHENEILAENITLYFKFLNGKQLYLDIKNIKTFSEVINELKYKYSWLQNIKIKNFLFKEKPIFPNKSLKEIGLEDNSTIYIIEE